MDDAEMILRFYRDLLGGYGYEVLAALNGRVALDLFRSKARDIDAVILDYEMPGMTGLELAILLKRHNPTLPIVMVSASDPPLEEMTPFVDAAIAKGMPIALIVDQLESLLAERPEHEIARLPS